MRLHDDWLIWQLADSAFPSGGFAHSSGLEAAWQHGEVGTPADLVKFVECSIHQAGHACIPAVSASYDDPIRLIELDQYYDAFMTNHVANRASRTQGRAFLGSARRSFPIIELDERTDLLDSPELRGHLAPVFGAVAAWLCLHRETTIRIFLFLQLRSLLSSAVRLGIVGPFEAQAIQHKLSRTAETVANDCASLTIDDLAQTAPLIDIWQGAQDRLYSRLFQS